MKTILITAMILLATQAQAGPFLTADDYMGTGDAIPTSFELTIDGTTVTTDAVPIPGGARLWYDLSGISTGAHTLTGRACNVWGCSDPSEPYSFTKSAAGKPAHIRITK